ncbi:MAG: hypothetical protein AAF430_25490 [Myxococcota bacterium]
MRCFAADSRLLRLRLGLALGLVACAIGCGPIGPFPGGRLAGDVQPFPSAWTNWANIENYQLETNPEDPHSINIWGVVVESQFYIPTSLILGTDVPAERTWVENVGRDPRVRLRAGDTVFELLAVRVEDPAEREAARDALIAKYEIDRDAHSEGAWVFRLDPRR